MRRVLILALATCTLAAAQRMVNPDRLRDFAGQLDAPAEGEQPLGCQVSPTSPRLNYSLRYQAGYRATVPLNQYDAKKHGWAILTRITPRGGERKPVYLVSQVALQPAIRTHDPAWMGGAYLVGEGVYDVKWIAVDDAGRVCRKSWRVDVHPSRADRGVKVAMPPDTVWDMALRGARMAPRETGDRLAGRFTVFLHAAPLMEQRTRMTPGDTAMLLSTVSALMERLAAPSVRLVVFNLDLQKELYRKDDFVARDLAQVAREIGQIELGLVNFAVLKNKGGRVDLLADLVNREMEAQPASDAILFLGPHSRYFDNVPAAGWEKRPGHGPEICYFQLVPTIGGQALMTDTIAHAVARLGGKTIPIHTPSEYAKAIGRLEREAR